MRSTAAPAVSGGFTVAAPDGLARVSFQRLAQVERNLLELAVAPPP